MALKIFKITSDIARLRDAALTRARAMYALLPRAESAFAAAAQQSNLLELAREKMDHGWDGALPAVGEPIHHRQSTPALSDQLSLIAVDGSQIYPDRHAAVAYYALNIGYFILRSGTGETAADSHPSIAVEEDELLVGGNLISNILVNARRSAQEMSYLGSLAVHEKDIFPEAPLVALLDGGVALRVDDPAIPSAEQARLQKTYFDAVRQMTGAKIPFAGYIARPGGSPVIELITLAGGASAQPFPGISDRMLFERILAPGERSAIFEFGTFWNRHYQQAIESHEQSVHFFYMNAGRRHPVVARVEIPGWVAAESALVDRIHAALIAQCAITLSDPYPYALIRADEEAFVSSAERAFFEREMAREFAKHDLYLRRSEKLEHKGRARRR
jgi:hypothetical protein